jgi:ATP-dependent helicase/nuclease subunit B
LLGEKMLQDHRDSAIETLALNVDLGPRVPHHPRPLPRPSPQQRRVDVRVTALDSLIGDPYQFYARHILKLAPLDALDAEPTAAWQGSLAHKILQRWHERGGDLRPIALEEIKAMNAHPLMRALWQPRLFAALDWAHQTIEAMEGREVIAVERKAEMLFDGVRIYGRADRFDRLADGTIAVVDYKTGKPPSLAEVEKGYRLQLAVLGLMVEAGGVEGVTGQTSAFEYWSLGKDPKRHAESPFGYIQTPLQVGGKGNGIVPEQFLPKARDFLHKAIASLILGDDPFTARLAPDYPGYADYDHLMRLDEWIGELS